MKIGVCVKRVPDSEARIVPADDGRSVDEAGIKFILNPYDEFAVEQALLLREAAGEGEVVAVTVGPAAAAETLRTTLAMGADRAVLLEADPLPPDPLAVARALADELRGGGYDLLLFGKLAIDDDAQAVGPMVATLLELPCVSAIGSLQIDGGAGRAEREIEGGVESVEFALPAVLTADKGLNDPRRPSMRGIMTAKKKPLETKPVVLADGGLEIVGVERPPEREGGRILGEGSDAVPALIEVLRQDVKVL